MAGLTREQRREKADATTTAALEIIDKEKSAKEAKVARLKALREAAAQANGQAPAEAPAAG